MDIPGDKRILWLWLSLACGPASAVAEKLLEHFGSVEAVYEADAEVLAGVPRLQRQMAERLADKSLTDAGEVNAYCRNEGVGILTADSPLYPARLSRIQRRPLVLYYRGVLTDLEQEVCIAEVGTRSMTEYGSRSAYATAYDLARAGAVVVSGMAKGVDGMAHRGALDAGGYTVAVLGCGIDRAYPTEHADLMKQIAKNGLVLTEYRPFTEPKGSHFPQRNRIISGLSQATVVIEAPPGSGALITARNALGQGRDVFALPGKVGEFASVGTNELIRDGARIVTSASDILLEYQPLYPGKINLNRITSLQSIKFKSPIRQVAAPIPFTDTDRRVKEGEQRAVARSEETVGRSISAASAASPAKHPEPLTPTAAPAKPVKPSSAKASERSPVKAPDLSAYAENQRRLLTCLLEDGEQNADRLAVKTGIAIGDVLAELTMLEIGGAVTALPGGLYEITLNS